MSLQNSQDDVEIQADDPRPDSGAQVDSNIEPLEFPDDQDSMLTVATRSLRRSISTERLDVKIWRRSTN